MLGHNVPSSSRLGEGERVVIKVAYCNKKKVMKHVVLYWGVFWEFCVVQ
jgi:hypothetical protein